MLGVCLQNMIDGLGITGSEGVFLRVCEISLSILRAHRETLLSVLETFIHDPLVEWTKSHKSSGVEVQNPHAQVCLPSISVLLPFTMPIIYSLHIPNFALFICLDVPLLNHYIRKFYLMKMK